MARWFPKKKGQVLSIALMGHPIGEATHVITLNLLHYNWREIWMGIGYV